ncbi:fimbria/pilus chaperone family protein [Pantoea phytobeneficialis]|uniref:Fimbria/pilus chaperone family protein n=1 Tax=Pantoea phytobeneficialis TaxID=2052056 RepID=A0AAP9KMM6_9GAMM|nr:fimbria/pilus chaperone family protein [Pantoea phytobeneficialis]MDO6408253.1 fimbria/pilus chaperone family protein [Pantoea phytobeneficialis]QGR04904.1 pilus assembly protein [Pantoea phytobeneficialis]
MTRINKRMPTFALASIFMAMPGAEAMASAVLPTTSVLIIEEADREGTIGIKNTNKEPVLLYSRVQRLEDEDLDAVLIPSPQAVVVQPGETQTVRLLYRSKNKLDKEHLARIQFMGIPPEKQQSGASVGFMVGQDLPVVIRPKGYKPVENKWQFLKWSIQNTQLCVANETKTVIRFVNDVTLLPGKEAIKMPKAYALPGSKNCAELPANYKYNLASKVRFSAVTDYNYVIDDRQAEITIAPPSLSVKKQ